MKPEFLVAGDRPWIALPYAKPKHVRPTACHFIDAGIHEVVRNTFAVELADDVQRLKLAGSIDNDAAWCFAPAQLCKSRQPSTVLAQQRDLGVGNLRRLAGLAVTGPAMKIHVFSGVHAGKRVPECLFGNY